MQITVEDKIELKEIAVDADSDNKAAVEIKDKVNEDCRNPNMEERAQGGGRGLVGDAEGVRVLTQGWDT
ncbi:hypothetical protein E2C01_057043 [Portunus trituberculatus]|uniref:Uncharacterized protein n=1 Tax=Portunus trituberculatus TaxID=210409 RepID=A0A5B7GVR8_PORTR|nr:hypothetical protein [Portunus trituberculatus]